MAIDTAEKRRSVSGLLIVAPGVTPNTSKDAEWRQEAGFGYPGISTSGNTIGVSVHIFRTQARVDYKTQTHYAQHTQTDGVNKTETRHPRRTSAKRNDKL